MGEGKRQMHGGGIPGPENNDTGVAAAWRFWVAER